MTPALMALGLPVAAPGLKDPPLKSPPSLVGEWAIQKRVVGGQADDVLAGATLAFRADGTTDYLGLTRTPPEMEFAAPLVSSAPGQAGIFRVEGDTLTLCLTEAGDRPTRFESPTRSRVKLIVLQRVKKKD